MKYSMVFPGIYKDEKVLFIPTELINIFTQADGSELESIVRRNTEWIRLIHALAVAAKNIKNAVGNNAVDMFLHNTHVECVVLITRV